jgi:hypothetical protein
MVSRVICLLALLLVCFTLPASAQSGEAAVRGALGNCGQPCVVHDNPGGSVRLFEAAAEAVLSGARNLVVIDGPCASACAIFADIARERVCITDRASFRFHKASLVEVSTEANGARHVALLERSDPPHSRDIARWVARHGGFPTQGMRVMSSREARAFWRRCSAAPKQVAAVRQPQRSFFEQELQHRND